VNDALANVTKSKKTTLPSSGELLAPSESEPDADDDDDDVFEVEQAKTTANNKKQKKTKEKVKAKSSPRASLSSRSSLSSAKSRSSDDDDDDDYRKTKRRIRSHQSSSDEEEQPIKAAKRGRGRPRTKSKKVSLSSVSSVSSLEDYAVTRKDGKKIKRITAKHSTKKRQRLSSSDEDEQPKTKDRASIRSSLTTSKGVSSSKLLNSKNTFLSQHDSSESSILQHASTSDSENFADETPGTASGIQRSTGYRPIKALKGSLESKLTRQESRITAVENNMQETPEMYRGKNLNDLFAQSAQRLAIKLAIAIKGDDLKDCVLTENGEASANSIRGLGQAES